MSKQVREFLEKNMDRYSTFERVKDAYSYFIKHNKLGLTVDNQSYDSFWSSYTKVFGKIPKTTIKKTPLNKIQKENTESVKEFKLKFYDPKKIVISDEVFVPMLTGKGLDMIISKDGGVMPGTTYVFVGGPGSGKSTICFDTYYSIQKNNKNKSCMALSAEMKVLDLRSEERSKPWMRDIKQVVLSEYAPEEYMQVIEKTILGGYEFLVIDSYQNLIERLKGVLNLSGTEIANWIFSLIEKANNGHNETGHLTTIFLIQQVTKGGDFVGKNNLEHDTTGMARLFQDANGERYISFSKNRRYGAMQYKKLYYSLNDNNEVVYDVERLNSDLKQESLLSMERKAMSESASTFEQIVLANRRTVNLAEFISSESSQQEDDENIDFDEIE